MQHTTNKGYGFADTNERQQKKRTEENTKMKSDRVKKLVAILAAVMIFGRSVPVYAATPVTGNLGGSTVTGTTFFSSSEASATTILSRPGTLEVRARGYYWIGTTLCHVDSNVNTASIGGVSVAVNVPAARSFVGSKGYHYVAFSGYPWTATSDTGIVQD